MLYEQARTDRLVRRLDFTLRLMSGNHASRTAPLEAELQAMCCEGEAVRRYREALKQSTVG